MDECREGSIVDLLGRCKDPGGFLGAQQDDAVVDKIMTALGQARQMQVGM